MNTAAIISEKELDAQVVSVRTYVELFTILFSELFQSRGSRFIARRLHARACDFMRGLEAVLRRVMLVRAALMVPTLAPAAPKLQASPASATKAETSPRPQAAQRCASFNAFRMGGARSSPETPAAAPSAAQPHQPVSQLVDITSLARRYEAITNTLANPAPVVLRAALRLRAFIAHHRAVPFCERELRRDMHPDHARYMRRDIAIFATDANEALRPLQPDPLNSS